MSRTKITIQGCQPEKKKITNEELRELISSNPYWLEATKTTYVATLSILADKMNMNTKELSQFCSYLEDRLSSYEQGLIDPKSDADVLKEEFGINLVVTELEDTKID